MSRNAQDMLDRALAMIDAANSQDPNLEDDGAGQRLPKELLYGRRMSAWLDKLRPDAPEALRIAVRAQHIQRWKSPRSSYPMDRRGYLRWRKDLYTFHADTAVALLEEIGYDEETTERVHYLVQKRGLNTDPDTQTLEDAACLVFLEFYSAAFAPGVDEDKLIGILRKTWKKMSPEARQHALQLAYPPELRIILHRALNPA